MNNFKCEKLTVDNVDLGPSFKIPLLMFSTLCGVLSLIVSSKLLGLKPSIGFSAWIASALCIYWYVNKSKKKEAFGSYLCVRVGRAVDVIKFTDFAHKHINEKIKVVSALVDELIAAFREIEKAVEIGYKHDPDKNSERLKVIYDTHLVKIIPLVQTYSRIERGQINASDHPGIEAEIESLLDAATADLILETTVFDAVRALHIIMSFNHPIHEAINKKLKDVIAIADDVSGTHQRKNAIFDNHLIKIAQLIERHKRAVKGLIEENPNFNEDFEALLDDTKSALIVESKRLLKPADTAIWHVPLKNRGNSRPKDESPVDDTPRLTEAQSTINAIKLTSATIINNEIKSQVERIISASIAVLDKIKADPESLAKSGKFVNVYLTGISRVVDGYAKIQKESGSQAFELRLKEALNAAEAICLEQRQKLFDPDRFNLDVHLDVLVQQMKYEGL